MNLVKEVPNNLPSIFGISDILMVVYNILVPRLDQPFLSVNNTSHIRFWWIPYRPKLNQMLQ